MNRSNLQRRFTLLLAPLLLAQLLVALLVMVAADSFVDTLAAQELQLELLRGKPSTEIESRALYVQDETQRHLKVIEAAIARGDIEGVTAHIEEVKKLGHSAGIEQHEDVSLQLLEWTRDSYAAGSIEFARELAAIALALSPTSVIVTGNALALPSAVRPGSFWKLFVTVTESLDQDALLFAGLTVRLIYPAWWGLTLALLLIWLLVLTRVWLVYLYNRDYGGIFRSLLPTTVVTLTVLVLFGPLWGLVFFTFSLLRRDEVYRPLALCSAFIILGWGVLPPLRQAASYNLESQSAQLALFRDIANGDYRQIGASIPLSCAELFTESLTTEPGAAGKSILCAVAHRRSGQFRQAEITLTARAIEKSYPLSYARESALLALARRELLVADKLYSSQPLASDTTVETMINRSKLEFSLDRTTESQDLLNKAIELDSQTVNQISALELATAPLDPRAFAEYPLSIKQAFSWIYANVANVNVTGSSANNAVRSSVDKQITAIAPGLVVPGVIPYLLLLLGAVTLIYAICISPPHRDTIGPDPGANLLRAVPGWQSVSNFSFYWAIALVAPALFTVLLVVGWPADLALFQPNFPGLAAATGVVAVAFYLVILLFEQLLNLIFPNTDADEFGATPLPTQLLALILVGTVCTLCFLSWSKALTAFG